MNPWLTNNYPAHRSRFSLSPTPILAGVRLLQSRGVELQQLQERWGFPLSHLNQPHLRLPAFLARRFWLAAAELDSDPALGLAAARPADLGQMLGLGYLMQLMPTRLQALETMQRFWPLVASHVLMHFEEHSEQLHVELRPTSPLRPTLAEADYWYARQVHHLRSWVCVPEAIQAVSMRRQAPTDPGPWQRLSGLPVQFGAERDVLILDLAALRHERPAGPASVRQALESALDDYARQTIEGSLLEQVSAAVLQELAGGLSLETLAERLHMTPRTLHRTLLRDGWSFSELIDIHRRYLAEDFLQDAELSVAEIADRLGYGEVNSFVRAVRRWFGDSPASLRNRAAPCG